MTLGTRTITAPLTEQTPNTAPALGPAAIEFLSANLTTAEWAALTYLVQGFDNRQIAAAQHVSTDYTYLLLRRLRRVFFTRTNAGLVSRVIAAGLIAPDGTRLPRRAC